MEEIEQFSFFNLVTLTFSLASRMREEVARDEKVFLSNNIFFHVDEIANGKCCCINALN
jgi:hypothetical protein